MTAADEIRDRLVEWVAEAAHLPAAAIDEDEPFELYGLDSAATAELTERLAGWLGRPVPISAPYEHPTVRQLADHLAGGPHAAPAASPGAAGAAGDVAIVGMAGRFPGAAGLGEFWNLLRSGGDAVTDRPPAGRGDTAGGDLPGGYLQDVAAFDHEYFGITAAEAREMDPQQRILLEVAAEALEDAGLRRADTAGSDTGVFVGIAHAEYAAAEWATGEGVTALTPTANAFSIAANRISYCLDLRGPSLAVDTACSSSLVALHLAARSLAAGETSLALAGGVNLILSPAVSEAFEAAGVRSRGGRCRPFDQGADGYVRSEGCGVVVLKPLAAALADRDQIYAVLRGSAVVNDGRSNGLLAPSREAQERLLRAACRSARVDPAAIEYVEAHGTGTQVGDAVEAAGLGAVLGRAPGRTAPCLVGSVKSNIGHAEAAAGIAGVIKAALIFRHGAVPPTVHLERPRPEPGLLLAATETPGQPRLIGVSSFGFGGTIAHAVLERPPVVPRSTAAASPRRPRVLPVSARAPELLPIHRARLLAELDPAAAGDLLYTAQQRRAHLPDRRAVLIDQPDARLPRMPAEPSGGVVFVLPGQGGSWRDRAGELVPLLPGLAGALAATQAELRGVLGDEGGEAARQAEFTAWQIALIDAFTGLGVQPSGVIGHSLGEVAAAYAAGVLTRAEALRVAVARGRAIDEEPPAVAGAMAVVELSAAECADLLVPGELWLAAENAPTTSVLAGAAAAIDRVVAEAAERGVFARVVPGVAFASHGPAVAGAATRLGTRLAPLRPAPARVPVFSSVTGTAIDGPRLDAGYWAANLARPVLFRRAVTAAGQAGHRVFLELSPAATLATGIGAALTAAGVRDGAVLALTRETDPAEGLDRVLAGLYEAGADLAWERFDDGAGRCAHLPARPWLWRHHWKAAAARDLSWRGVDLAAMPGVVVREARLPDDDPAVTGHVVGGRVMMPATGWLTLAGQALDVPDGDWIALAEVEFTRAYRPDPARPATVQFTRIELGPGDERFSLHLRDTGWQEHVTGRLGSAAENAVASTRWTPPETLIARCPGHLPGADLYRALGRLSLDYGPGLRHVAELWTGPGEAVARLTGYRATTGPLDAALHAVAAATGLLSEAGGGVPAVPRGFERVRIRAGAAAETAWSHVVIRPDGDAERIADVRVVDAGGALLAELLGLRLSPLVADRPAVPAAIGGTYEVRRHPAGPHAAGPARRLAAALWVGRPDGDAVTDRLRSAGISVRVSAPAVEDVRAALESSAPAAVIWDLTGPAGSPEAPVLSVLDALREVAARPGVSELVVLTSGVDDARRPDLAAVPGLLRCAGFELPQLRVSWVDLPAGDGVPAAFADALATGALRPELVLRDRWYAPRLAPVTVPGGRPRLDGGAYLITGGLGGLGLAVAERFAERGARRLVLLGRGAPDGPARQRIDRMAGSGCEVVVRRADVTVAEEVRRAADRARAGGVPLRGVVHAAGVLRDRALLALTPDDVTEVMAPKTVGARHLHEATLDDPLEFFVLFSSAAALLGSPGQGNYAAANAYLDGFARWRRAGGRVATAVGWGPWGEIGMVAGAAAEEQPAARLVRTLDPATGLDALEAVIAAGLTGVAVLPYDVGALVHLAPAGADPEFFGELAGPGVALLRPTGPAAASSRPGATHRYVAPEGPVATRIAGILQRALGIDRIGADDSLYERGGDSVLAGQVLTRINREYDVRLDTAAAFADFTVRHLARLVDGALVAKVAGLSDEEAQLLLDVVAVTSTGRPAGSSSGPPAGSSIEEAGR
ncbi:SDR family NAD(P)-dependent oxidoreductase [Actinoplanes oblitus]|uniref:SDR family NAD(P)-dependent oxidoreductase n=1 Tax=Actinoplanes oblitus TaxID=3040509 RepID=A0ABY8W934_9ACTN|nr:type I polyketide synthase [Actinoplanes oblitus]WIM94389.1 SDR family NAD(P)-dependent oxidoreductase [Actinoplanes oblitus]